MARRSLLAHEDAMAERIAARVIQLLEARGGIVRDGIPSRPPEGDPCDEKQEGSMDLTDTATDGASSHVEQAVSRLLSPSRRGKKPRSASAGRGAK
jgi:hypothetical protein